jgi:hypothetical protein
MKRTFIALMALCLCLAGCGKKEVEQTAKERLKTNEAPPIKPDTVLRDIEASESPKPKPPQVKPGTVLWKFETGSSVSSSPAIGSDGTVYVGSQDNKLYAIKTESLGPAKSPWPMRGQNAQHTGRAPKKK